MWWLVIWAAISVSSAQADGFDQCQKQLPYVPQLSEEVNVTPICHHGYAALHDDDHLIPRFVSYVLTGSHTLGCEKRANKFHEELQLPADRRATLRDYLKSGYDRGHNAPNSDFAWSKAQAYDSFSLVNMTPQAPHLNQWEWERLEEVVRTWAWDQGVVTVITGPVIPANPKTIGEGVAVPSGYWKVIVNKDDSLAFLMPNVSTPKGDLAPFQATVSGVERVADIGLPVPGDHTAKSQLWNSDIPAWNAAHKQACERN